jgi:hypothetical protein
MRISRSGGAPVKQAVIAASAISLLYPQDGIDGYPRERFLSELIDEAEADIRGALQAGGSERANRFHRRTPSVLRLKFVG